MKRNYLKLFSTLVLLFVVVLGLAGCKKDKEPCYYIGLSGPLTGGAAIYGTAVNNSAKMAVEEINAKGGLNGVKFKLVMTDDAHDPTKVANNFTTLYEDGMQVSLGCVTTKPCLQFNTYAAAKNVFYLTPSATGDNVVKYANAYQMCFSDSSQGTYAARYVKENVKDAKIGIFYMSDDDYSKGIYNNFIAEFSDEEIKKFTIASFTDSTSADFSGQVESLKDCTFIFMPIYYTPASTFMTQAVGKIANNAVYFGCDGFDGIEGIKGFDIEKIPQEVSYLSHFNASATEGKAAEFITKYKDKYGVETLNQFGAAAYDCIYTIYNAMKFALENGKEFTYEVSASDLCGILVEVFQNPDFTVDGVTGTGIKWNQDGTVNKSAVKYVVKSSSAK